MDFGMLGYRTDDVEANPCPKCGNWKNLTLLYHPDYPFADKFSVSCRSCFYGSLKNRGKDPIEAIENWNKETENEDKAV